MICDRCGTENPERAKFCLECAAPLVRPSVASEVRKTVTIVFCDITGSTSLGESVDPESLRSLLASYFERMKAIVERHGGTVEKFIGDAVMAVFGVPVLHEDDALRALRAAAEMRDALPSLGVQARIGVNTGEVVAGTGERLVTGDAVNVAARLEQAAPPHEVYVGARTVQLARGAVEVEPVEPLELKGKSQKVEAFRLVSVTGPEAARRMMAAPFVGREREHRHLREAFDLAVSDSACQLFTLLGVAGVGKSRLVAEFLRGLDATVVRGRCLAYGEGITYWPVVEAVKQLRPEERVLDERVARPLSVLLGDDAVASKEEIAFAVRRLFEEAARERPLVVVWDDLHWAEEAFLDLVEHLADWSRDAPIVILCMARPELLDRRPGWAGGKLHTTTVLLEPLGREAADRLLVELAGNVEEGLRERILAAAEGNPLFVEEMVAMLEESTDAEVTVPPSIQALLSARLDQLPASERAALERGAVEGQVFHRSAVQALAPEDPQISTRLLGLVRKELVRPEPTQLPGDDAFRFRHILIRDAAYDALPKKTRADLHERFAVWLDEVGGGLVELDEIVGHHLEQACRYLEELGVHGERARRLAVRASERLADGGRGALARDDARSAATLLARAGRLRGDQDVRRAGLLMELAEARFEADDLRRARDAAEEALELALELDDEHVVALARVQWLRARALIDPEFSNEVAIEELDSVTSALARFADDDGRAKALALQGLLLFFLGRTALAMQTYERAAAAARRAGNARLEAVAVVSGMGARTYGPTPVAEAIAFADLAAERLADPNWRSFLLQKRALLEAMRGDFDAARDCYRRCKELTFEYGLRLRQGVQTQDGAWIELLAGDAAAAERELREGYAILAGLEETGFRSTNAAVLADALLAQGRIEEAADAAADALALTQADDATTLGTVRWVEAQIASLRGDFAGAIATARDAVALLEQTDYVVQRSDALVALARVCEAAGESGRAVEAARSALDLYERKGHLVGVAATRAMLDAFGAAASADAV
jgi:class 3 adenylate cyclase/tetratricopeptide (TPR) repeat protein